MKILIAGDTHHHFDRLSRLIHYAAKVHQIACVYHVGDLGLDAFGVRSLLGDHGTRFCRPVYLIDGNHDDRSFWVNKGIRQRLERRCRVHLCDRGTVHDQGGRRLLLLGGALNTHAPQVDGPQCNYVTPDDVDQAIAALEGATPDVVITHSCPAGVGLRMHKKAQIESDAHRYIDDLGYQQTPIDDPGEMCLKHLRDRLDAFDHPQANPPAWVFGHWHCRHTALHGGFRYYCAGVSDVKNLDTAVFLIYDTDTGLMSWETLKPKDPLVSDSA